MPIQVTSFIIPKNGSTWYLVEDIFLKGGYQSVASVAVRDAINPVNFKAGMLIYTQAEDALWQLNADLLSWKTVTLNGTVGPQGPIGITGPIGPKGDLGTAGVIGATGPAGQNGQDGRSLHIDSTGPFSQLGTFATAPAGFVYLAQDTNSLYVKHSAATDDWTPAIPFGVGLQGIQGIQGLVGPKGDIGAASTVAGPQGIQGIQGLVGAKGDIGMASTVAGPIGATGSQGAQGVKGDTGAASTVAGPQGIQGITGDPGNSVMYGTVDPIAGTGTNGNFFINTTTDFIFGPKIAGNWPAGASLIGPQGSQGIQGIQGVVGSQGIQGPVGPQGNTVLYGVTDPAAGLGVNDNFFINTATHTMFGPKSTGTWPAGVSLIGPQGSQGIQGPQGPTGAIGSHAGTHAKGGTDPLTPAAIGALSADIGGSVNGDVAVNGKLKYANVYPNFASLPDALGYEGMFASTEDTNKPYFSNDGIWVELAQAVTAVIPYDISFFVPGNMSVASELVGIALAARTIVLTNALPGSIARAKVAPAASMVYALTVNGASKGSVTFAAGALVGTFTMAANLTLAAGDTIELTTPAVVDASIKDVSVTLVGRAQAPQGTMSFV